MNSTEQMSESCTGNHQLKQQICAWHQVSKLKCQLFALESTDEDQTWMLREVTLAILARPQATKPWATFQMA